MFVRLALPFVAALMISGAPVLAQNSPKPVATVNGEAITEADVKLALEDLATQLGNIPEDKQREVALDFLIEVKLAAQAAKKAKLDQSPEFASKLAYARDRIMMERLLSHEGEKAASDVALKKFYDDQVAQLKPIEEVRARHILVEQEDEARKIHARLKAGEDFAKVAAETSKDPGSGQQGGDLGFFAKERMVPEFAEAAFALKAGELSPPVKSQFGWHVIRVEERRTRPVPAFNDVKDRLAQALVQKAQNELVEKLKKEGKIERATPPAPEKKP